VDQYESIEASVESTDDPTGSTLVLVRQHRDRPTGWTGCVDWTVQGDDGSISEETCRVCWPTSSVLPRRVPVEPHSRSGRSTPDHRGIRPRSDSGRK
jgi:hypothetical protein